MNEKRISHFNIDDLDPNLYDTRPTFFKDGPPDVSAETPEGLRTDGGIDYEERQAPPPEQSVFEKPVKKASSPMAFPNKRGTPTERKGRRRS